MVQGTGYIWIVNKGSGALTRINTKWRTAATSAPVCTLKGAGTACLAQMGDYDPIHCRIWVSDSGIGTVSIFR